MNNWLPANDGPLFFGRDRITTPARFTAPRPPRSWWARLVASVRAARNAFVEEWRS